MYRILPPYWNSDEILLVLKYLLDNLSSSYSNFVTLLNGLFYPKNFILLGSGRSAIYAILKIKDFPKGSKVIIPSFVCAAAISPILKAEMIPIFVDVMDDLTMDPTDVERKIGKDVKMIIMPHTYGKICDYTRIREIAKNHNLLLVDDASPCAGLKHNGATMGLLGDYGIFSMNYKTISSVLGGGIIFNDEDEYEFFKLKMRLSDVKGQKRVLKKAFILIVNRILYKSNLYRYLRKLKKVENLEPINEDIEIEKISDLAAAIGYRQFQKMEAIQKKREANSLVLRNILENNNDFIDVVTSNRRDYFTRFVIELNDRLTGESACKEMENMKSYLLKRKVQSDDVYIPGHMLLGGGEKLPKTEDLWQRCFVIPNNPLYDKGDMEYIGGCVNSYFVKR